jgi:hypothetical protein
MSGVSEHRFTFPVVQPAKAAAPTPCTPSMSQRQLVEQSLLRCPTCDGGRRNWAAGIRPREAYGSWR